MNKVVLSMTAKIDKRMEYDLSSMSNEDRFKLITLIENNYHGRYDKHIFELVDSGYPCNDVSKNDFPYDYQIDGVVSEDIDVDTENTDLIKSYRLPEIKEEVTFSPEHTYAIHGSELNRLGIKPSDFKNHTLDPYLNKLVACWDLEDIQPYIEDEHPTYKDVSDEEKKKIEDEVIAEYDRLSEVRLGIESDPITTALHDMTRLACEQAWADHKKGE